MKKTIIYLFAGCMSLCLSLFAQIPNNGFENWTTVGAYQVPNSWSTLNNTTAQSGIYTVTKGTPGNPGTSYMKITSRTIGPGVVGGIAVCGRIDTVAKKPICGFSYTQAPLYFTGSWQHMIYGSSQGSIMILLSKWNPMLSKRDTVAFGGVTLSGMAMSWANFAIGINYVDSIYPDSCLIVLKASGANPTNNDYLWVDNLAFTGSLTMPPPPPPPNPVGINENIQGPFEMRIYPCPAKGHFTLSYELSSKEKIDVQIMDLSGKIVKRISPTDSFIGTNSVLLDSSGLSKGIYTIFMDANGMIGRTKLVIE
ncbi:MAG: T9SS type A sorting domain-containing protein [bacterium]|nr:T9SS type A sorting domain-containing protein [bacterium]